MSLEFEFLLVDLTTTVSYTNVKTSNAQISTALPSGLVAVFVGATSGIGEYAVKQFAKHAKAPRVYLIGRSQEAGNRISRECQQLNSEGSFTFIKADCSLIKNIEPVSKDLQDKEKSINLLFMTIGTLDFQTRTSENLKLAIALAHYARLRFVSKLLPQLQAATSLKRVVSVFAATKEGPFDITDVEADKVSFSKMRGHGASMVTLGMESFARQAPDVSFIHDFPGPVKGGAAREMKGVVGFLVRNIFGLLDPLLRAFWYIPNEESGDFQVFFSTSASYPARSFGTSTDGVPLSNGIAVVNGVDGEAGSGMYSIDEKGETGDTRELQKLRDEGLVDKVRQQVETEWARILQL